MDLIFLVPRNYSKTTQLLIDKSKELNINYKVSLLEEVIVETSNEGNRVIYNGEDILNTRYVFPRIDGKRKSIGIKILSIYELKGVKMPYPSFALEIIHDKFLTSLYLSHYGISVPKTIYAQSLDSLKNIHYPIILKLLSGSGGKGVMLIENEDALESVISTLQDEKGNEFLIQEYIKKEKVEDIRILVSYDKVIGAMKRIAKEGEIRANVKVGGNVLSYEPTQEEERIALKAAKALNLKICAVDIITTDDGKPYVIELNLNPGIRGLMKATSKDIAKEIMMDVKEEIKR